MGVSGLAALLCSPLLPGGSAPSGRSSGSRPPGPSCPPLWHLRPGLWVGRSLLRLTALPLRSVALFSSARKGTLGLLPIAFLFPIYCRGVAKHRGFTEKGHSWGGDVLQDAVVLPFASSHARAVGRTLARFGAPPLVLFFFTKLTEFASVPGSYTTSFAMPFSFCPKYDQCRWH